MKIRFENLTKIILVKGSLITGLIVFLTACGKPTEHRSNAVPEGMVLIPGGNFTMGGRSEEASRDEFPRHEERIASFYMDATEVTNAQFERFVEATGYITVAEKDVDWEEMKKQVPEGTPRPADSLLVSGSLVFKKTSTAVNLNDYSQWWGWKPVRTGVIRKVRVRILKVE